MDSSCDGQHKHSNIPTTRGEKKKKKSLVKWENFFISCKSQIKLILRAEKVSSLKNRPNHTKFFFLPHESEGIFLWPVFVLSVVLALCGV